MALNTQIQVLEMKTQKDYQKIKELGSQLSLKTDSHAQIEKDLKELLEKNQKLETANEKIKLELKYQEQFMTHEQKRFTTKLHDHACKSNVQQEKII